jgi:hypothetical protein
MTRGDQTLLLPAPVWDDPRVHLLDDLWLLAIFAILLAIALPWFLSGFDVDLAGASWGLLALGAVHVAFTTVSSPTRPRTARRARVLGILNALGVIAIGYVWQHAGGLQNPMFLIVFALPVIGAVFISRWQPYLMSVLAIVVVTAVALAQAPELRWYATGLNTAGAWLASVFGSDASAISAPFPGFYAPSSYFVVLLEVFAILTFACAVAAEHLGSVFERLYAHVATARAEAERGQELWATLIEHLPLPALLVDADTSQVICASEHLAPNFCELDAEVPGSNLYESIRFSYPEVVQELIAGFGGTAPLTMIRVGGEIRVTEVRVQHVAQKGRRFALVIIADATEEFCLKAALDTADHAALVIDTHGHVLGFNKQAIALFPGTGIGADASGLLAQQGHAGTWWEPGLNGRRRMHVEIPPRVYQVTISAVALPGEEERIHVVAFLPVGKSGSGDQTTLSTRIMGTAVAEPR